MPLFQRGLLLIPIGALAAVALTACGANKPGAGATSNGAVSDGTCAKSQLQVLFSPMYSAYDGVHTFQVPAIVNGAVSQGDITWSLSDPTVASIATDPSTGGAMITTEKAGTTTVVASEGSICGSTTLTVTATTQDAWASGSARYNNGIKLPLPIPNPDGGRPIHPDGGDAKDVSCTNCHGSGAVNGKYNDIAHTPEQTGGFSDTDLVNIFTKGQIPDGGYFDANIVSLDHWSQFHQWTLTSDEAAGVVVYLRSLTPTPQTGSKADFGGHRNQDAGM